MAIYQRDNINYGGMLGNAMANRANYLQRRYDRVAQMGQNWGNAVQQSGKTIQDALYKIAGNYYEQDKLAAQQQFQHDEALKRAEEQLARQREQEAWQAQQNELNRQNTYDIAALNRQSAIDDRNAEKQAQAIMHYDVQKGILNSIADEIMRTDDPAKLAQLYRQRDEAAAKLNYYAPMVPEAYRGQRYGDSFLGFHIGMGKDRVQPTATEQIPQPTKVETVANRMAGLVASGKAATKSADIQSAINELSALDTSKLNDAQRSAWQTDIATLKANLAKAKKAEETEAAYQAELAAVGNNAAKRDLIKRKYGKK